MNPADPDTWTDEDWRKYDAASAQFEGRKGESIARALDMMGWMIVPQPWVADPGARWPMMDAHDCPAWAEPVGRRKRPGLRLIEGGKGDGPPK